LFKRTSSDNDGYYLFSRDVRDKLSESFGDDFEIENFSVDTLFFNFPRQTNRRVPIASMYSATFKNQYMALEKMKLVPDSVTVYGDYSLLQNIDSIRTDNLNFENLEVTKTGVVKLSEVRGVRFSKKEVYYTLEVERYIEKSLMVPVGVINSPADKVINLFPAEVKMIYRIPFKSAQKTAEEKFKINIDFNDIINSINSFVEPKLEIMSGDVLSFSFDPQFVECRIIEKFNQ
jgi:hypothetical protein